MTLDLEKQFFSIQKHWELCVNSLVLSLSLFVCNKCHHLERLWNSDISKISMQLFCPNT